MLTYAAGLCDRRNPMSWCTPDLVERSHLVIDHAMTHAIRNLMFLSIITCLFAILCTFLLKRSGTGEDETGESEAESP